MTKSTRVTLLLTGDEIMAGDIVDSNSAMIAHKLAELGLKINKKVTVGDDLSLLAAELNALAAESNVLIVNGGLGPTVDDLTAQALAQAAGVEISQHPQALSHLTAWVKRRGAQLNEPNLKQTMLPKGCDILANPLGSAVGFKFTLHQCTIYCTPGVPKELKVMLDQEIMPALDATLPGTHFCKTEKLQIFGLGESSLQRIIDEQLPNWPQALELGFRAALPTLELKITCHHPELTTLQNQWVNKLKRLFSAHIIGTGNAHLVEELIAELNDQRLKVTTAESCTGGLIASKITQIGGASKVFEAGYVTYSNEQKMQMLDVDADTLAQHGAVSRPVVEQMLRGALKKSNATVGVAVSGIAGPEGGSIDKPVGTVWIAWGRAEKIQSECLFYPFDRKHFQQYVAYTCLDLLRREILGTQELPDYIVNRRLSVQQKSR